MKKYLACSLAVFIILCSCQKEIIDPEISTNPTSSATDSNYLYKVYILDSTSAGTFDTVDIITYTYDNSHRITAVVDSSTRYATPFLFIRDLYSYNGADTMPYKSVQHVFEFPQIDTSYIFYYYDNTGFKIKDSTRLITNYQNTNGPLSVNNIDILSYYTKVGSKIYGRTTDTFIGNPFPGSVSYDTATLDANKNMIASKHVGYGGNSTNTATFDNHPSILANLNIRAASFRFMDIHSYTMDLGYNNPIKLTEVTPAAGRIANFGYTYDARGRVKTYFSQDANGFNTDKSIFVYRP